MEHIHKGYCNYCGKNHILHKWPEDEWRMPAIMFVCGDCMLAQQDNMIALVEAEEDEEFWNPSEEDQLWVESLINKQHNIEQAEFDKKFGKIIHVNFPSWENES